MCNERNNFETDELDILFDDWTTQAEVRNPIIGGYVLSNDEKAKFDKE